MEFSTFLNNNLFTSYTLQIDFPKTYNFEGSRQEAQNALDSIKSIYDKDKFQNQNEHQFENDFISKVLEILGWHFVRQDCKIIQGKLEKPDFLLFTSIESKKEYEAIDKEERYASNAYFSVILESKEYNLEVDNRKINDNPHFQLLRYLSNLKKDSGFLTNGRVWRFYDITNLSATKIFYEINLEYIIESNDINAFQYFYHIFNAANFHIAENKESLLSKILEQNIQAKMNIEDDLQSLIYGINGKDSVFEKIGACIYDKNQDKTLKEVYESALYFAFRLLFIAYFEDKFSGTLDKHAYFNDYISLYNLLNKLKGQKKRNKETFVGLMELNRIFYIYNSGEPYIDIPVFNGGLFDDCNAPLLQTKFIFNDKDLIWILDSLFHYESDGVQFRRDYRTLSIAHLGTIYEGLLSYFFAIADEDLFYLVYEPKKAKKIEKGKMESEEGYYDGYDYADIKKSHIIHRSDSYKKGQIYLKNTSNSRKSTASFYTPDSITKFLVKEALRDRLDDSNILHFKILDNACGSGHFLVEALSQITQIVSSNFDLFPALKAIYEKEKMAVQSNMCQYIDDYEADENDILKRLLLKRVIFGLDLNPFSIELAKLALWIDSFIFGTPLSFLEHHIKCGNALIGTSIKAFKAYYNQKKKDTQSLFIDNFLNEFNVLGGVFEKLDSIKDTTEAEILESKHIYSKEISPILSKLNLFLNILNAKEFMNKGELALLTKLTQSDHIESLENKEYQPLKEAIESYAKKFSFFNYEIEFPEIVSNNVFIGFQAIVGNPPWDKTKFSDNDFFPQYRSRYRTRTNAAKEEIRDNLLAKEYILREYNLAKEFIESCNDYYKRFYPLNAGSGDGNLFRFFVERNIGLIARGASLNYVLPSALMLEEGSYTLRKHILENLTLSFFYGFENRNGLFRDVDSRYKFAMMQIKNEPAFYGVAWEAKYASSHIDCSPYREEHDDIYVKSLLHKKPHKIKTMFYKTDIEEAYKRKNIVEVSIRQIYALSPTQLALQEVRGKQDLKILSKCYRLFKSLSLKWLDFRNELHMTQDRDLFIETNQSIKWLDFRRELDMTNDSNLFIESYSKDLLPLYEGKMIHQYNAEFGVPRYFLDSKEFDKQLRSKEIYRLKQDLGIDAKKYRQILDDMMIDRESKEALQDSIIVYDRSFYRLAFRAIARDTDERTLICSLLPKDCGGGNSIWINEPKKYILVSKQIRKTNKQIPIKQPIEIIANPISHLRILFALGIFNSLTLDYIARSMVQINVNKTYLERIPLPQPSDKEILESNTYMTIALNALKMQLYHDKTGHFDELREEFNIDKNEIPKTQKLYDTLKAQTDIIIARDVYKLSKEEFLYMLESFKILREKQGGYVLLLDALW